MMGESTQQTVRLIAGTKTSGEPVFEEVLVERLAIPGHVRVLASPGVVLDVAAGDVIKVDSENHEFSTVSRGGNLAIQVYGPHDAADSIEREMSALGGRIDGRERNLTVFTVPASVGFPAVERVLNLLTTRHAGVEWYYGNVYEKNDGVTPLKWWL
ncbi:DUF4265 domain-containing protein [Streptomyces sp. NPDC086787]|uniref:DUF4265 domain-containing protein n=1 Tax=Streptomyces sp. NPDC086787 TaxID=3365759 RepID=UPI00381E860E